MSRTKSTLPLLDQVSVASPCPANWEDMEGGDQKRFCQQCKLHVYDLSAMTAADAESFLQSETANQKRACIRMVRRADGRVLTRDCPVGIRRLRLRAIRAIAAAIAFLCSGIAMAAGGSRIGKWAEAQNEQILMGLMALPTTTGYTPVSPVQGRAIPDGTIQGEAIMGDVCIPEFVEQNSSSLQPGLDARSF